MSSTTILGGRRVCTLSTQWPGRSVRAARFLGRLGHLVSNRPIWLAEAADPVIARSSEPSEHRLTQQARQSVATVLAGARVGERIGARLGQPDRIIQLAIG